MPVYEYFCSSCSQSVDLIHKLSDENIKQCPNCKSFEFQKMVSAPNFKLKGTGWYETDFKNPPKANTAKESTSNSTKDAKKKSTTDK